MYSIAAVTIPTSPTHWFQFLLMLPIIFSSVINNLEIERVCFPFYCICTTDGSWHRDLKKTTMTNINRTMVLNSLIKHETLTITDIAKEENLGIVPDKNHLNYLINELVESGHVHALDGVIPTTYTITTKGINEGMRLQRL